MVIKCKDCGKEISDKLEVCIHCTCQLKDQKIKDEKETVCENNDVSLTGKILAVVVLLMIIGYPVWNFIINPLLNKNTANSSNNETFNINESYGIEMGKHYTILKLNNGKFAFISFNSDGTCNPSFSHFNNVAAVSDGTEYISVFYGRNQSPCTYKVKDGVFTINWKGIYEEVYSYKLGSGQLQETNLSTGVIMDGIKLKYSPEYEEFEPINGKWNITNGNPYFVQFILNEDQLKIDDELKNIEEQTKYRGVYENSEGKTINITADIDGKLFYNNTEIDINNKRDNGSIVIYSEEIENEQGVMYTSYLLYPIGVDLNYIVREFDGSTLVLEEERATDKNKIRILSYCSYSYGTNLEDIYYKID